MTAYYNEIDPFAAAWLRELIRKNVIAPGEVDERSIVDVRADDLRPFTQCHFFAGIGVWSYALRQAGWPDDRPVWTGSCPCQGFSAAGQQKGFEDERHLWPTWYELIRGRRPAVIFGEQVSSKLIVGAASKEREAAGWNTEQIKSDSRTTWFDLVQADLEDAGYASAAFDIPAAGVGSPNIRQRLFFTGFDAGLGDSLSSGLEGLAGHEDGTSGWAEQAGSVAEAGGAGRMGNGNGNGNGCGEEWKSDSAARVCGSAGNGAAIGIKSAGPVNGFWSGSDWILCRDGRFRPVESGTFALVDGTSGGVGHSGDICFPTSEARKGRLKGYGNAINAEVAIEYIKASMEAMGL